MPTVMQNNGRNPLITVSADEVVAWLRKIADEVGYADRETRSFQLNVEHKFYADNYHHEAPSLTIVVSNIPNSRR